jgi:hypothetical protein
VIRAVQSFGKRGDRILSKLITPLIDRQTDRFHSPNTGIAKGEPPYTPTLPAAQETAFREAVSLSRNVTTGREGKLFSISETSDGCLQYSGSNVLIFFFNSHSGGWSPSWVHSARQPFTGLLYLPRVIMMMENGPSATLSTTNPT